MRIRFIFLLGNKRWFWRLRNKISYARFTIKKHLILWRQRFEIVGKATPSPIAVILILSASTLILFICSRYFSENFKSIAAFQLGGDQFSASLAAMVGVHGVLIGLHFALISALVTQSYNKASLSVIGYITKEKDNLNYAILNVLSITFDLFLFLYIAGKSSFSLAPLLVSTLLCLVCVAGFVLLATKSFYITDPSRLATDPLNKLLFWARSSTISGYLWKDKNFQNFYRQRADETMDTIAELSFLAAEKSEATQKYLKEFSGYLFKCFGLYKSAKRSIPPSSFWFSRKLQHRSWDLADDSRLQVAAQTMTSLDANQEEPNHSWLEERLMNQLQKLFAASLESPENSVVVSIIERINNALEMMGNDLEVEEAFASAKNIRRLIQKSLNESQAVKENAWIKAVIIERAALFASGISVGFFRFVDSLDLDHFEKQIATLDWKDVRDLQKIWLPIAITKKVEDIAEKLAFETTVERKRVSPNWYCRDLIYRAICETFHNQLLEQIEFATKEHLTLARELFTDKDVVSAALTCIDGLQHCHKILGNLPDLKSKATSMFDRSVLKDLMWPDWKWDEYEEILMKAETELHKLLAECIEGLSSLPSDSSMPDLLGEATFKTGMACFEALRKNDEKTFNALFSKYLSGCIYCSRRQKKITGITDEQFFLRKSVVILDALHLSGYAILYSELYQNEKLWMKCKKTWNDMFLSDQNKNFFKAVIAYYLGRFGIKPRDILRTTWQMTAGRDLDEKVEHTTGWSRDGGIGYSQFIVAHHPSPLIRTISSGMPLYGDTIHLHFTGLDIFIDMYLLEQGHFSSSDFGRRAGDLREEIRNQLSNEFDIDLQEIRRNIDDLLPDVLDEN